MTMTFLAEIDGAELACRMLEAIGGLERPTGASPIEALDRVEPATRRAMLRAAQVAVEYLQECLENGAMES